MSIPAAYLTVILIWSTTPLAIKWSAQGGSFSFAVASRMAIGLVVAGLVIAIWRVGLPLHRRAQMSYLVGGLSLFGAMTLTWALRYPGAPRRPSDWPSATASSRAAAAAARTSA